MRALRLTAAADAVFQRIEIPLPFGTGKLVERGRASHAGSDGATQAAARAESQVITLEQAVAYALE